MFTENQKKKFTEMYAVVYDVLKKNKSNSGLNELNELSNYVYGITDNSLSKISDKDDRWYKIIDFIDVIHSEMEKYSIPHQKLEKKFDKIEAKMRKSWQNKGIDDLWYGDSVNEVWLEMDIVDEREEMIHELDEKTVGFRELNQIFEIFEEAE
jgi:hypothetical protein